MDSSSADYDLASGEGGVDRSWYLQTYPDVERAEIDPVLHYLHFGWLEGRDPRGDFSTCGYQRANKDAEGNPLVHFLKSGRDSVDYGWHAFWQKGFLHPRQGSAAPTGSAFGAPGVQKILFTGHEASRTGAPLILLRLMEEIGRRTGAEMFLILERGGPLLDDYQRIAHVLVNQHGMLYRPDAPKLADLLRSIAQPAPDLAICNCADGWRLIEPLRAAGIGHLVSLVHERVVHYPADVWQSIHRNSDRVVFSARAVKGTTCELLPEFEDAAVIPQGLLNADFGRRDRAAARADVRAHLGLSKDAAIVLGCGTQDARKGIDLFIQLAARVCAQTRRDVHFVWLGARRGDLVFARLIELDIRLLNLKSSVSVLDEVADPEPYFLAADAFALTSRDDPFPCVIHEAMACALPIVVFDGAGGAKEAIADGCGMVVPYLEIGAMARFLVSVVDHPSRYEKLGRRAQARVRSTYRFTDYAERILGAAGFVSNVPSAEEAHSVESTTLSVRNFWADLDERLRAAPLKIRRMIRVEQWWNHKLAPMFAVFYAMALIHHAPVASIWRAAVALLIAVAPGAAYVSLVNDLTDRVDDHRAGKTNRMSGKSVYQMTLLLAAPLSVAVFFCWLWRDDPALVAAYLGGWTAFSLYSIPPFRLKERGIFGVFADASGSHVFPTLIAALLVLRVLGSPIDPALIATFAIWALGCGLRGILWHQLFDFEADRTAGVQTFVVRRSRDAAVHLARFALFIEIAGLAALLWRIASPWPVLFLALYATFAAIKSRLWNIAIVIAEPRDRYAILGQEYYIALFPLSLLLASALRNPIDWIVLIVHCIVFFQPLASFAKEARLVLSDAFRRKAIDA